MNEKYYKSIIEFIIQRPGNYDFKRTVELVGVDTVAELCCKAPGKHLYIPSQKTLMHWLAVMTIKNQFKSMDEFKTQEGKQKAKKIAKLFNIRPYQIKKIFQVGRFTR